MKKCYTDRNGNIVEHEEWHTDTIQMLERGDIQPVVRRPVTRKDMVEGKVTTTQIRKGLVQIID